MNYDGVPALFSTTCHHCGKANIVMNLPNAHKHKVECKISKLTSTGKPCIHSLVGTIIVCNVGALDFNKNSDVYIDEFLLLV